MAHGRIFDKIFQTQAVQAFSFIFAKWYRSSLLFPRFDRFTNEKRKKNALTEWFILMGKIQLEKNMTVFRVALRKFQLTNESNQCRQISVASPSG